MGELLFWWRLIRWSMLFISSTCLFGGQKKITNTSNYTYFIFNIIGFRISTAFKELSHNYGETLILGNYGTSFPF